MKSERYRNIFFQYALSQQNILPRKCIVFLTGLPGKYKQYDVFDFFLDNGFDILYPRYEGTGESEGEFLARSPVDSITEFLSAVNEGIEINGFKYISKDIFIVASSFGGGISLCLTDYPYIQRVCLLSPVISYKEVHGIETLEMYIKENYSAEYRFKTENWELLIEDKLFCPKKLNYSFPKKILIIAGKTDEQVNFNNLENFAKERNIKFILEETGHISFSKINLKIAGEVLSFFK